MGECKEAKGRKSGGELRRQSARPVFGRGAMHGMSSPQFRGRSQQTVTHFGEKDAGVEDVS
jgi:hypothetical protein